MKKILAVLALTFTFALNACGQNSADEQSSPAPKSETAQPAAGVVIEIDQEQFAEKLCDYTAKDWNYKSSRPAVIDFNATWCGPCRQLAPILKELAAEMPDIDFYSIDIDENRALAKAFGVRSIPMLLICPVKGDPQAVVGLYPKEDIVQAIQQTITPTPAE